MPFLSQRLGRGWHLVVVDMSLLDASRECQPLQTSLVLNFNRKSVKLTRNRKSHMRLDPILAKPKILKDIHLPSSDSCSRSPNQR